MTSATCVVCGGPPRREDPAVPDEFYPTAWCHARCLNSPEGLAWREARMAADPGYARYLRLSTVGLPIECSQCRRPCSLSAKARGMGAGSWEACCTACSRFTFLNGYVHAAEYEDLSAAEQEFLLDETNEGWRPRVRAVALIADAMLMETTCACGARFSLAAPPRCPRCSAVLLDSFFHYGDLPATR